MNIAVNINIHETLSFFVITPFMGFLSFFASLLSLLFLDIFNNFDGCPPFIQPQLWSIFNDLNNLFEPERVPRSSIPILLPKSGYSLFFGHHISNPRLSEATSTVSIFLRRPASQT